MQLYLWLIMVLSEYDNNNNKNKNNISSQPLSNATAHALKTLKKLDGTVMIEQFANDKLEDN